MRPYVDGIRHIRKVMEPLYQKHDIHNASDLGVNPFCYRANNLFLEIFVHKTGEKQLQRIWTPCGEVQLTRGGCWAGVLAASKEFFRTMGPNWDLQNVSDIVKIYYNSHLQGDFFKGPDQYGTRYRIYRITRIKHIFFPGYASSDSDLMIYEHVSLSLEQRKKDKSLFLKLSNEMK